MPLKYAAVAESDALVIEAGREFDRWIVGEAVDSDREYIVHLSNPKFIAKFLDSGNDDTEEHIVTGGLSMCVRETTFYDIIFFEEPPGQTREMTALFQAAEAALIRYYRED